MAIDLIPNKIDFENKLNFHTVAQANAIRMAGKSCMLTVCCIGIAKPKWLTDRTFGESIHLYTFNRYRFSVFRISAYSLSTSL